ncbi:MAG: Fe-S cluster assembly protein SufD [Rikenellaceae bacterium]|nr:Fe-S cluster assembly protein SufD [Rikenellaceae bacterium]
MESIEKKLTDLYLYNRDLIDEDLPDYIIGSRREALESFNILGLPDRKSEKYKYSDIKSRYELYNYEKYFSLFGNNPPNPEKILTESLEIKIVNGYSGGELHVLSNGIIYGSLRNAANDFTELVKRYYNKLAVNDKDSVSALNTMFMQDGAFIYVPKNTIADTPFTISNLYDAGENTYAYNRNLIIFEENSSSKVIFNSKTSDNTAYLINGLSEVFVEKNASSEILVLQRENNLSTHLSNFYSEQAENSNLRISVISTDGGLIRNNWNVYLRGKNAETHNYGLYISGCGQSIDNHTNIEHLVPDCTSFEKYKGIVSGDGKGIFNGRILVEKDAQRTRAFQENHNLILSDVATIDSKPQLEIYADDVKCSHGATVGQLDENAIFYMRQRGISEATARKLQMYGFINDIVGEIGIMDISDKINDIATKKIERL